MSEIEEIYLEERYKEIINPKNLFKNLDEVKLFIKDSKREDLIWFLRACEEAECYSYCLFIANYLENNFI